MSERYNEIEIGRERQVDGALERLKGNYGFEVEAALKAGEREFSVAEVRERAMKIADELEFDEKFFADDGCAMTLLAVAESSVAADGMAEERRVNEQQMLTDVIFAIGAGHSPVVQERAQMDTTLKERYFDDGEITEINKEQMEFLDAHVDEKLSAAVYEVMKGDFLADVRDKLGVTTETEQSYDVKVVKMVDSRYVLEDMGVFGEKIKYPPLDADYKNPDVKAQSDAALEWHKTVEELAGPYEAASEEYKERFEPEFGPFIAFLDIKTNTIYMSSEHAYAIVGDATLGGVERGKVDKDNEAEIARELVVVKHEYVHSQKIMTRGAHSQLGLAAEERRAELLSGDRHGYLEEKNFFLDLTFVTKFNMLRRLSEASKADDVYAACLAGVSNSIGMRAALLMMTATPPVYEKNKEMRNNFVDLDFLKKEGDDTIYDAIIGEEMERFGGSGLDMIVDDYVEKGGIQRLKDLYGLRNFNRYGRYRLEAMKRRIDELEAAS